MPDKELKEAERAYLQLVSSAAFSNPFGDERAVLDAQIAGLPAGASAERCIDITLGKVRAFLEKLKAEGRGHVDVCRERDRSILLTAQLFDIFHRFMQDLDGLIDSQLREGDALCPVRFWKDVLGAMMERGIRAPEAARYFAMFYQLRRAYYFINSAITGRSPSIKRLRWALWNNVFTHDMRFYERYLWNRMEDFSTLILGETGTGKGAAATAIGRAGFIPFDEKRQCFSESFMRCFLSLNLSQFPEALIESELFRHRKGAFTGAIEAHEGVFSRCSPHGAIFLDEIGDVSIPVQIKLLQVLQERAFSPVGSHEKKRFHGRVIAATNRSIDELRHKGLFRDDFFYRLCSDVIVVPPLRDRMAEDAGELEDLTMLSVRRIVGEDSPELAGLVGSVLDRDPGRSYRWPGNVRELEQAVRRILLTRRYPGDRRCVTPDLRASIVEGIDAGSYSAEDLLTDYCVLLHGRHGTYEEVARRTGLDRRTAKKYVQKRKEA